MIVLSWPLALDIPGKNPIQKLEGWQPGDFVGLTGWMILDATKLLHLAKRLVRPNSHLVQQLFDRFFVVAVHFA